MPVLRTCQIVGRAGRTQLTATRSALALADVPNRDGWPRDRKPMGQPAGWSQAHARPGNRQPRCGIPRSSSRRRPRGERGKDSAQCRGRLGRPAPKPRTPSALRSRIADPADRVAPIVAAAGWIDEGEHRIPYLPRQECATFARASSCQNVGEIRGNLGHSLLPAPAVTTTSTNACSWRLAGGGSSKLAMRVRSPSPAPRLLGWSLVMHPATGHPRTAGR